MFRLGTLDKRTQIERDSATTTKKKRQKYFERGSNSRPSVCETDVITTTLSKLPYFVCASQAVFILCEHQFNPTINKFKRNKLCMSLTYFCIYLEKMYCTFSFISHKRVKHICGTSANYVYLSSNRGHAHMSASV